MGVSALHTTICFSKFAFIFDYLAHFMFQRRVAVIIATVCYFFLRNEWPILFYDNFDYLTLKYTSTNIVLMFWRFEIHILLYLKSVQRTL